MRKSIISLIALILAMITCTCQAASYTLPEKMSNQLAIGSGLKGTFTITSEGEKFSTPFLKAVSDADFSIRGISSGKDFHYYIFQTDEKENQSAVSELYRRDGICFFRSDMVQGKILALPTIGQYIEAIFPATGENGSSSSFVSGIISLPEEERKDKWDPVLNRYQNELELWLADFMFQHNTVKLDSGLSALDFTYEIPIEKVTDKIIDLYGEITSDAEASALLSSVMSSEERQIFANGNLLYFYQEALKSLDLEQPIRMNKRVSAMGDLLRFRLELPLDERTTGYRSLEIETVDQITLYTIRNEKKLLILSIPGTDTLKQKTYEQTVWYACINTEEGQNGIKDNRALRFHIKKTNETHEEEEKTHETDHYSIIVQQDTSFLPEDTDLNLLPEYEDASIEINLHYSSKFAQNSATTLDITADIQQGTSSIKAEGTLKTAAPWLFMPFEVIDPIETGTKKEEVLIPYLTDWISNASSMIRHHTEEPGDLSEVNQSSEAIPLPETTEKNIQESVTSVSGQDNGDDGKPDESESFEAEEDLDAETRPLEDTELP